MSNPMQNSRQVKDKKIKIFMEVPSEFGVTKKYIHPEGTSLNAYIRQLSATEQNTANAIQDGSAIEFVINNRKIKTDMHVEFKGKTYQMGPPDNFEFYKTEVKFIAYEVNPRDDYIATEWSEWNEII